MKSKLLKTGGVVQVVMGVFHIWLGWKISNMNDLMPAVKILLEIFNTTGALMIFFFAYASFFCGDDMQKTMLGRGTTILIVMVYLFRAFGEFLFPQFSLLIFIVCITIASMYLIILVFPETKKQNNKIPELI